MNIDIAIGTVLGASEYVADAAKELLESKGHTVELHLDPELSAFSKENTWLIITSTHGAGELPDNIQPFAEQIKQADLSTTKFMVIGLGDSSYDTYCYGAQTMQKLLETSGASLITAPLHIDVLQHPIPEETAVEWLEQVVDKL